MPKTAAQLAFEANRPELLVLVRHGESLVNANKKGQYWPDDDSAAIVKGTPDNRVPLTPRGMRQAQLTSPHLRSRFGRFDVAYDSGYLRTTKTREGLLSAYLPTELADTKLRTSSFIHERLSGYTYNMTKDEVDRRFPWMKEYWETTGPFYAVPMGGESQEMVCRRVYTFIGTLFEHRRGKKVLVATHGGTLRAFRFNLERWTADEYTERYMQDPPANCGVTVYRFNPQSGRLELEAYNQVFWKEEDLVGI